MAIETLAKRMNMLSFASPLAWQFHSETDGAVDFIARAQFLHMYGGNQFTDPTPPVTSVAAGFRHFLPLLGIS